MRGAVTALTALTAPSAPGRWAAVRALVVGYAVVWSVVRIGYWADSAALPATRWRPVGVVRLVDDWFGGPPSSAAIVVTSGVVVALGLATLVGRWAWPGWGFALGFLFLTTFGASWGQILHTENLVALHVLVVAVAPNGRGDEHRVGWPLRAMTLVTVATYVVAGIAKFRFGGGWDWLSGERLMRLVAHDNLRKELLGDRASPFAPFLLDHGWLFRPAVLATVLVELGAPVVLLGWARLRQAWIAAAWLFHLGVLVAMAVLFLYPLSGVAFASMLPVERAVARITRRRSHDSRLPARRPLTGPA